MDLEPEDERDPAITEEVRALLRPRARGWLVLTVGLALLLALAALGASHTALGALW
jgi:hypothetical protein